ncbi:MAG: hypothetical protein ABFD92_14660 [Planctomycetaceae bacterium]|nr:hypothetical protein [Planctomycetaceae bacterium]
MTGNRRDVRIRVDRYTQVCLTVIAVLLTVLIVGLWADFTPSARSARAADDATAAEATKQLLEAQNKTTAAIERLPDVLRSGEVKVQVMKRPARPEE